MAYWLIKSEPTTFSLDDLIASPQKSTEWNNIRNYQARNFLKVMKKDDRAFFYHSSCKIPAIVGIVRITEPAFGDMSAFDPDSDYFDPKHSPENPRWFSVRIQFESALKTPIPLEYLKKHPSVAPKELITRSRLSVMPVSAASWAQILKL